MEKTLTTNEIFQESMKLSGPAYEEKGEKLKVYQDWLKKKWTPVEDNIQEHTVIKDEGTLSVPASGVTKQSGLKPQDDD